MKVGFALTFVVLFGCVWSFEWHSLQLVIPDELPGTPEETREARTSTGSNIDFSKFPFLARLTLISKSSSKYFQGSLVSSKFVLSRNSGASKSDSVVVSLGSGDWLAPEFSLYACSYHYYMSQEGDNLAIYELERIIAFSRNIQPVRLPPLSATASTFDNQQAIFIVWDYPRNSQSHNFRVVNHSESARNSSWIDCRKICAIGVDDSVRGACTSGNDGGGLITTEGDGQFSIVGVLYVPPNTCGASKISLFTQVSSYLQFIHDVTGVQLRKRGSL